MVDYFFQFRRNFRVHGANRRWCLVKDCVAQDRCGVSGECTLASRHLVKHKTKRKQVSARVQLFPANLLRRHIPRGADCRSRAGERERGIPFSYWIVFLDGHYLSISSFGFLEFRQTKVQDLDLALCGKEDIRGFNIAMDNSFLVRSVQSLRNLNRDGEHRFDLKWSCLSPCSRRRLRR